MPRCRGQQECRIRIGIGWGQRSYAVTGTQRSPRTRTNPSKNKTRVRVVVAAPAPRERTNQPANQPTKRSHEESEESACRRPRSRFSDGSCLVALLRVGWCTATSTSMFGAFPCQQIPLAQGTQQHLSFLDTPATYVLSVSASI